jgi:hypothetical protein
VSPARRIGPPKNGFDNLVQPRSKLIAAKSLKHSLPQHVGLKPPGGALFVKQLPKAHDDGLLMVRVHEQSELTIGQRIDRPVDVTSQDRNAARHGFQKHDAEPLTATWHRADVRQSVMVRKLLVRNESCKNHVILNVQLADQPLDPFPIIPLPHDQVRQSRKSAYEFWQCTNDKVVSFVALARRQPSHREDYRSTCLQSILPKQFRILPPDNEAIVIDRVSKNVDPVSVNSCYGHHMLGCPPADTNDSIGALQRPNPRRGQSTGDFNSVSHKNAWNPLPLSKKPGHRTEVNMRADYQAWPLRETQSQEHGAEGDRLPFRGEITNTPNLMRFPHGGFIELGKHSIDVAVDGTDDFSTEGPNATAELFYCRRPDIDGYMIAGRTSFWGIQRL